jgi:hypothetical protein
LKAIFIPVNENYIPAWLTLNLVWMCLLFTWLEAFVGSCVGCKIYALLVKIGIVNRHCDASQNVDWDKINRYKQVRIDKINK